MNNEMHCCDDVFQNSMYTFQLQYFYSFHELDQISIKCGEAHEKKINTFACASVNIPKNLQIMHHLCVKETAGATFVLEMSFETPFVA